MHKMLKIAKNQKCQKSYKCKIVKIVDNCQKLIPKKKKTRTCSKIVRKLQQQWLQTCYKPATNLLQTCYKPATNLPHNRYTIATQLLHNCLRIVSELSQNCQRIVK